MNRQELGSLYDAYLEKAEQAEQKQGPFDGLFGLGKKASDDPCHDRFAEDVNRWLTAFRESQPDSASVREVLSVVYHAPKESPEPLSAYWMMTAVQGLTRELIPLLSSADAGALAEDFAAAYSRRERMPVQKQILDALKKAAK